MLLDGIRVVDLSQTVPGSRVTQFMADHGAEVIFVEPPGGSPLRKLRGWPYLGRGKRSVVADLKNRTDLDAVLDAIRESDVVVSTFRPGVAKKIGLDYEVLSRANPAIISAAITGFGQHGPWSNLKGYEGTVLAKLGVLGGFKRGAARPGPKFLSVPYASFAVTQTALHGILAALFERETSGLGQEVDANLVQSFAALDCWQFFLHLLAVRYPGALNQTGAWDEDGNPTVHTIFTLLVAPTSDGVWLQFSQLQPHLFAAFLQVLGMADVMEDPSWSGLPIYDRVEDRIALLRRMYEAVGQYDLATWQKKFEEFPNVFGERFRKGPEVLEHPQLSAGGWVATVADPEAGLSIQPARMAQIEGEKEWTPGFAPRVGDYTEELDRHRSARSATSEGVPGGVPAGSPLADLSPPPLAGVTILDLAAFYAAPYSTSVLSDLGARVIHVEQLDGDPIRTATIFPEAAGVKVMQGKESIAVDLASEEGRSIIRRLLPKCDALLQGYRAGVADRLGFGASEVRSQYPHIVYVDATGYGMTGPYRHQPSYANSIAAAGGQTMRNAGGSVEDIRTTSFEERKDAARRLNACTATLSVNTDGLAALGVASAIMLGLVGAKRGNAPHIETTMLSNSAHVIYDCVGVYPEGDYFEVDSGLHGFGSLYRLYETKAGWVFLAAPKEREWIALVEVLRPYADLEACGRFTSAQGRRANDVALGELLGEVFARRSALDWERDLTAVDVACVESPAESTEEILMSSEVGRASGYVTDVVHPTFDEHPRLAPLVRFSRSRTQAGPGCLAGEHTQKILSELGYDDSEIETLYAKGVVR